MPSPDRKQKILDHLNQSVEKATYLPRSAKAAPAEKPVVPAPEVPAPPPPPPVAPQLTAQERRRQILSHVRDSSGNFGDFSLESPGAKNKKMEHIRKSLG
ncbi:MAG: hypothetical protein VKN60_07465 [Cyanobacteriota bacterium]|nr:hypothetical protein [Cyanobacteriota bacterium]